MQPKSAFAAPPAIIANIDEARRVIREELLADVRTVLICIGTANDALPRTVRVTVEVLHQLVRDNGSES